MLTLCSCRWIVWLGRRARSNSLAQASMSLSFA